MYFRDIIGQTIAKDELRRSYLQGIVPHARLFVGEDGAGALGLAYAYARYINCEAPTGEDACGQCRSCHRFDTFSGQDLHFLFPILNVNSRNLCEDELPRWREFLTQGAHARYDEWLAMQGGDAKRLSIFAREGDALMQRLSYQITDARYRILIIWLPERMNETLGNKLLKLTEEPPERTIILMVAMHEAEVLGTLRSRMQTIHLRPLSEGEIALALSLQTTRKTDADISRSAHLAGGNYRDALDDYLGSNTQDEDQTKLFGRILRATVNARPLEIRALADEIAKGSREEQIGLLAYAARMFREIYIIRYGVDQINYLATTESGIAKYLRGCLDEHNTPQIHAELDLAIRHIGQNVNSRMVFFDLIIRLTSILAPSYKAHGIR